MIRLLLVDDESLNPTGTKGNTPTRVSVRDRG